MSTLRESLAEMMEIEGATGAAVVDYDSGVTLGTIGGDVLDMELAGAGTTRVMHLVREVLRDNAVDEPIEDVLVSLDGQYHLTRFSEKHDSIFTYLVLDRSASNLALARRQLAAIEATLALDESDEET
jgi:predicted regulator of Ras-like GTPase activity (Roadblock/LC7/MglB family)